jgi:hypothetical protein
LGWGAQIINYVILPHPFIGFLFNNSPLPEKLQRLILECSSLKLSWLSSRNSSWLQLVFLFNYCATSSKKSSVCISLLIILSIIFLSWIIVRSSSKSSSATSKTKFWYKRRRQRSFLITSSRDWSKLKSNTRIDWYKKNAWSSISLSNSTKIDKSSWTSNISMTPNEFEKEIRCMRSAKD